MFNRQIIFIFILILSGVVIYLNALNCPFVFDDNVSILNEKNIRMSEFSFGALKTAATQTFYSKKHFRPVVMISFALNYYFDGYQPRMYHIVNIFIHILAGISLYFFIHITLRISCNLSNPANAVIVKSDFKNLDYIAFFSALIWMVNPVHVQSVTYITQRMTSMMSLFFVLSLFFYARGRLSMITSIEGSLLLKQGNVDKAIQHFKAALKIDPNYSVALKNLKNAKKSNVQKIKKNEKTN